MGDCPVSPLVPLLASSPPCSHPGLPRGTLLPCPQRPMATRGPHLCAGPSGSQGSWDSGDMPCAVCLLPASHQRCVAGGVAARGPCGHGQGGGLAGNSTVPPCPPLVCSGCRVPTAPLPRSDRVTRLQ